MEDAILIRAGESREERQDVGIQPATLQHALGLRDLALAGHEQQHVARIDSRAKELFRGVAEGFEIDLVLVIIPR